jgi:surface antigen
MSDLFRGLYRIKGAAGLPNDVRVSVRHRQFDMTEAEYRQREYEPSFHQLAWHSPSGFVPLIRRVAICA